MLQFVQTVNSYLADYILIILLIGTGIYFTVCTRFVQIHNMAASAPSRP